MFFQVLSDPVVFTKMNESRAPQKRNKLNQKTTNAQGDFEGTTMPHGPGEEARSGYVAWRDVQV